MIIPLFLLVAVGISPIEYCLNKNMEPIPCKQPATHDVIILGVTHGLDLWSTSFVLKNCSTCYEKNPLGRDTGTRFVLKSAVYPLQVSLLHFLRRHDKNKIANIALTVAIAVNVYAIQSNLRHGINGR